MRRFYNILVDNYRDVCRWQAGNIEGWYPAGHLDVVIDLGKNDYILYNDREQKWIDLARVSTSHNVADEKYLQSTWFNDEQTWRDVFGCLLYDKILTMNMIQEEVADKARISRVSINRYVRGKATPSLYAVNAIANVLKCTMSELYVTGEMLTQSIEVRPFDEWDYIVNNIMDEYGDEIGDVLGWYPVNYFELAIRSTSNDRYWYDLRTQQLVQVYDATKGPVIVNEDEWRLRFSEVLCRIMEDRGVNRSQLAKVIDVAPITIYKYMRGIMSPSYFIASKISTALNCNITDFQVM